MRKAFAGYEGAVFLISNPWDTPWDTFTTCNTGTGALLWVPSRFGSVPPLPVEAIPVRLGAGASLVTEDFPAAVSEVLFLTTIGSETAGADGASFSATTVAACFDESTSGLALIGWLWGLPAPGIVCTGAEGFKDGAGWAATAESLIAGAAVAGEGDAEVIVAVLDFSGGAVAGATGCTATTGEGFVVFSE